MMYGWDGGMFWMTLMPLVWIVLIGLIVWAAVTLTRGGSRRYHDQGRGETPEEILDRRFASGELDADDYQKARATLAEQRRGSR
ncbi:putative membrane protein [Saccharopolyspora phatthalungensis]|uniref:Putative membrane protein n=1 Tax=Saccharopolyspora phatthalungensis TaxID=664693 RepID=A0A840QC50_9PSEU|nr:putative membrane protein [Saccharopolyspora phatthalungensis]